MQQYLSVVKLDDLMLAALLLPDVSLMAAASLMMVASMMMAARMVMVP